MCNQSQSQINICICITDTNITEQIHQTMILFSEGYTNTTVKYRTKIFKYHRKTITLDGVLEIQL